MNLLNLVGGPLPLVCPQCGEGLHKSDEFCARCGSPSPANTLRCDPLRLHVRAASSRVHRHSKFIVRLGVLGFGLVSWISGGLLSYTGWVDPSGLDAIQLWISRIAGPMLLGQGVFYLWVPFRKLASPAAPLAKVIRLRN
jgi:hypothetical protein